MGERGRNCFLDFLRFPAVSCGSKPLTLQIKDQICQSLRKSSTSCRFSLFSLSHLALPDQHFRIDILDKVGNQRRVASDDPIAPI